MRKISNGFGMWLRNERRAAGLTQTELADRVGCSKNHISLIEIGAQSPGAISVRIAKGLAVALNLSVEVMVDSMTQGEE